MTEQKIQTQRGTKTSNTIERIINSQIHFAKDSNLKTQETIQLLLNKIRQQGISNELFQKLNFNITTIDRLSDNTDVILHLRRLRNQIDNTKLK
jgi:hypothetical protein